MQDVPQTALSLETLMAGKFVRCLACAAFVTVVGFVTPSASQAPPALPSTEGPPIGSNWIRVDSRQNGEYLSTTWIRSVQNLQSATELVKFQRSYKPGLFGLMGSPRFEMSRLAGAISCSDAKPQVIREQESEILYEQVVINCPGLMDQDVISRIIWAGSDQFVIQYLAKGKIPASEHDQAVQLVSAWRYQ